MRLTAHGTVRAPTPPPQMRCSAPRTLHVSCPAAHADGACASEATIGVFVNLAHAWGARAGRASSAPCAPHRDLLV